MINQKIAGVQKRKTVGGCVCYPEGKQAMRKKMAGE